VFSLVFRGYGGDELVNGWLSGLPGGVIGATIVVMLVIFLLGFILDFIEITFVVVPIVGPALLALGIDPIWLGVMIAINLQTSFLTPPFGFALFYLRGVAPPERCTVHHYSAIDACGSGIPARTGYLVTLENLRLINNTDACNLGELKHLFESVHGLQH
jgi:TRAP-type mannitol/chloroaromatic compound transport system permease large subunit